MADLRRLGVHTMTTKPWSLEEAIAGYMQAGVPAITVWRQHLEPMSLSEAARALRDSGLRVTSLCRGGFFPSANTEKRQAALDDNRMAIDQARAIGAPLVVLVCGAEPGLPLEQARGQIVDGIAATLDHAAQADVKLAIEPLHPMYAGDRSAINTLAQANDAVEMLASPWVGVAVDVYHVWWDPALEVEIQRCGQNIFAFHVCDWRTPTRDLLNDRGLMGEGCIPIPKIRALVEAAGFAGDIEVEIFSNQYWAQNQSTYLEQIKHAFATHC